jgi:putative FmdB family regulatory protein
MPVYQFICEQCGTRFDVPMSIAEHDQNRPECPKCHSEARVHGEPSTFTAVTSRKS